MAAKNSKQGKGQGASEQVATEPLEIRVQEEGPIKRNLTVHVPATRVKSAFDRAYQSLGGRAKVPGFRKGKIPRNVLEQNYGDQVRTDVVESLIESCCAEALREKEIAAVANPQLLSHDFADGDVLTFQVQVEVRPPVELKSYKGLEVERRIVQVEESHVDEALSSLRERYATLVTEEDRINVANGDVVVFEMDAYSEGQHLENASGEGVQMEVGAGRFPEELEKGIVGVTRSIPTSIDVHFPEDHRDAELAGKLVRFQVTVREIKNKILPPLNDELASEVNLEGCDTLADLRVKVREDLEARAGAEADRRARNELLNQLVDAHEFDVPDSLVDRQVVDDLQSMGVRSIPDEKVDEIRKALQPGAVKQVRARFILDAIATAEDLDVSDEDLGSEVNRQIATAGEDADRAREYFNNPATLHSLKVGMLRERALARLAEISTQRDVKVDESQVADLEGSS